MVGKGGRHQRLLAMLFGLGGLAAQAGQDLGAHALDRVGVEARRGRAPAAAARTPRRGARAACAASRGNDRGSALKPQLDRVALEPLLERLGVELAGALVEQRGDHVGDAGLVGRVLAGAAAEGEVHGDQRHRRLAHQPGLDAARADDALDRWCALRAAAPARGDQRSAASGGEQA